MRFLPRRFERPLDVTIQCSHHSYPGEHRRSAGLSDQQKRLHRGLPFFGIVFGLRELGDVERSVAEGDELLALGQFNWIEKMLVPRQDSPRPALGYPAAPLSGQPDRLIRRGQQQQEEGPVGLIAGGGSAAFRTMHDDIPLGCANAPLPISAALLQDLFKN
jgi:hypothetical protein